MSEGPKNATSWMLTIIAIYSVPTGLIGMLVGMFVGPPVLIAATAHLLVGLVSIAVLRRVLYPISSNRD